MEESYEVFHAEELCFFHGLTCLKMSQHVLSFYELPALTLAEVIGLRVKMCGPHPAIVDSEL